ncbi:MAG: hypothetical protein HY364_05435 [Candidatus Aenigmarchaeota archaeon]|nr:hypothetical protein [Candidatus Aenigmarchaeota archaeon]
MAVFSDVDIRANLGNLIDIENFDEKHLRPNSYDVDRGDLWEVTDSSVKENILEVQRRLGSRGIDTEYMLPELKPRQLRRLKKDPILVPKNVYIAECVPGAWVSDNMSARIIPRSRHARDGLYAFNPNLNSNMPFLAIVPHAYAKAPEHGIAQMIIYERGTKALTRAEIRESINNGNLYYRDPASQSEARIFSDEDDKGFMPARFANELVAYKGNTLGNGESSEKFSNGGSRRGVFDFYLGVTVEEFGTGKSHILWMLSDKGHIYPNAPLCNAGVPAQQHTLEVTLNPEEITKIKSGRYPHACRLRAYALKTPASADYAEVGNYNGQTSPLPRIA